MIVGWAKKNKTIWSLSTILKQIQKHIHWLQWHTTSLNGHFPRRRQWPGTRTVSCSGFSSGPQEVLLTLPPRADLSPQVSK